MSSVTAVEPSVAACREASVVHGRGDAAVRALDHVSLEVGAGERVALLGRSGSGKTTLLHVLGGLLQPSEGRVERHGRAAFVFQSANLFPYFTAFENVAFAAGVGVGTGEVVAAEAAVTLLGLCGLAEKLDHLPSELSGGEAQRVAIARALAQRPELMLCDEPTGHLDSETGTRVLDLIDALQDDLGFALVVATHDPDVASRYARQIEVADGAIIRWAGPD
jgi:ABC-type lipoprotein export system ATPase subunit